MNTTFKKLTSGRLLARNAFWNLSGMVAPMLVALIAIPLLIEGMGKERFGLLTIVWMGVGYFSLFDLGLGRALTKMVSEHLGRGQEAGLGSLIWTALSLLTLLGMLGAVLLLAISHILVVSLLQVPPALQSEAIAAFRILAVGVPIVILTAGIIGILEAHQRFGIIAGIRIPLGVLTFAAPLIVLQFTPSIAWATLALLVSRIVALLVYYWVATSVRVELRTPRPLDKKQVKPLLSFGGWLTVTNIVGPLMTYLDRFFVSAILGLSAVAYYATPYEVLSRLKMLPQAVMGVMFPAMSAAHGADPGRLVLLYANSSKVIYWVMLPVTAGAFLLAPEALLIWLGEDFSKAATPVVHWLAAGWMVNTLARAAFTVLQTAGRPDLVAKTHLAELIPYLGLLLILANAYGIAGVAAAWMLRALADALALNVLAAYQHAVLRPLVVRTCFSVLTTGVLFAGLWALESLTLRVLTLAAISVTAAFMLWPILRQIVRGRLPARESKHTVNNQDG